MRDRAPYRSAESLDGPPCPRCRTTAGILVSRNIGQTPCQRCERCAGVWLTAKAFNELVFNSEWQRDILETTDLVGSARRDRVPLSCPHCRGPMQASNFGRTSGAVVDTCRKHGIWFDVGELRLAVGHLSNHIERADLDARIAVALASIDDQPRPAWHSRLAGFVADLLSLP